MQNVISVPSAARANFEGLGILLAVNITSFVGKVLLLNFCFLFIAIVLVKLNFIELYGARWVKRGVI